MRNLEKEYKWVVCVSCMTYNHASYIEDAMNGFCMQETDFPFVCTIIDDASTDGEQEVIKRYLEEHFDLEDRTIVRNEETENYTLIFARHKTNKNCYFAVLYLKYNHYSIKKDKMPYITERHENCKYIALCEGDDYWIDGKKLQKQVDFLEEHTNIIYLFTGRLIRNEIQKKYLKQTYRVRIYTTHDILSGFNPGIQNVCFRKEILDKREQILKSGCKNVNGDRLLPYCASLLGGITCINDITSVYRFSGKGVSTSVKDVDRFLHASTDFYIFWNQLGKNDIKAYFKGEANYLGNYFKINVNKSVINKINYSYKIIKEINPNFNKFQYISILYYVFIKQIRKFVGVGDVHQRIYEK